MKMNTPSITYTPSFAHDGFIKRRGVWTVILFFSLAALNLLSGCSVLKTARPANVYLLPTEAVISTAQTSRSAEVRLPWSLRINRPTANGYLLKCPIVVIPSGNKVQVYTRSVWNNPPPILLRDRLQDAFRSSGQFASLSTDEKILFADYEIDSDLRSFQSEYREGVPVVVLVLDVRLIDVAARRILSNRLFTVERAVNGASVEAVVSAFGLSAGQLTEEVVEWTVLQLAPHRN